MTNTIWGGAVSANCTTAADWIGGVPTASVDAVINTDGAYTVTLSSAGNARSLTMDATGATLLETAGGGLTMAGGLMIDAGTVILNSTNNFGAQTRLIGGTLELGNATALGTSGLRIDAGALVGTASETIANAVEASGTFTLAAAFGDFVTLAGQTVLDMNGGGDIVFGKSDGNGVFVWDPLTLGIAAGGAGFSVDINAGWLRDDNGSLSKVLSAAESVNIAAGAVLNIHGFSETVSNLNGSGAITSTANGGVLTVTNGDFSGIIGGALSLTVGHSLILTGADTFSGRTVIDSGAKLSLDGNGNIDGSIVDNGILEINHSASAALFLNHPISGSGSILFDGGLLTLSGNNTFSGGTTINGGILEIGNAAAIGTGEISFDRGGLIGTATETLSNQLFINGGTTFSAAHGTTLTLNAGAAWTIGAGCSIVFGNSTNDGAIVWYSPPGSVGHVGEDDITIAGGTLRAGDATFQSFLQLSAGKTKDFNIEQGGTLDIAGFASTVYRVAGDGTIENSGAATTVTLVDGFFTGTITGPIALDVGGVQGFGGAAANFDTITVLSNSSFTLAGPSSANVVLNSDDLVILDDPTHFTGSIGGLQVGTAIKFVGIATHQDSITYSGDTTGGTLTLYSHRQGISVSVHLVGNYTQGEFSHIGNDLGCTVIFTPSQAPAALVRADAFNFDSLPTTHVAADASVMHLHGSNTANEIASDHHLVEAAFVYDALLNHFTHGLFAHEHAFAEALT